jgi:septation ring formation regulator EzrA
MIKKVSEQWEAVDGDADSLRNSNKQELKSVADKVGEVRQALRSMCKASVTRTTLKEAVSTALEEILRERGEELVTSIPGLQERLAGSDATSQAGAAEAMASVDQLRERLDAIEAKVSLVVESGDERLGAFDSQIRDELSRVSDDVTGLRSHIDGVDNQVRDELSLVSNGIVEIKQGLGELEESVPETAKSVLSELEFRLRKEISEMIEQLTLYVGELKEMLGRVEERTPSRAMLESMGADVSQRLERIEQSFSRVSTQVEHIDSTTPVIENMGESFRQLHEQTASAQLELNRNTEGVEEIRVTLGSRLDELEGVLREVLGNWDSDQSEMAERLSTLRDSLRDQLKDFHQQVEGEQTGIWNKLRGNKEPGLRLSGEEFGSLSGKLEGIITGLETVISKKKES